MHINISKEGVFIPSFNGNKELSAADQISVRYRTPTYAIKSRVRKKAQCKGIADKTGSVQSMEVVVERDDIATLTEMLITISNCSYDLKEDGSEKVNIVSAKHLIEAPLEFEPLLKEIVKEFDRIIDKSELNEKN